MYFPLTEEETEAQSRGVSDLGLYRAVSINLVIWPCNWLAVNSHDLIHKMRNRSPGWKEDGPTAHREAIHPVRAGLLEDMVCPVLIGSCDARLAVGWGVVPPAGAGTKQLAGVKHANPGEAR